MNSLHDKTQYPLIPVLADDDTFVAKKAGDVGPGNTAKVSAVVAKVRTQLAAAPLTVAEGGTGGATAELARLALGAEATGAIAQHDGLSSAHGQTPTGRAVLTAASAAAARGAIGAEQAGTSAAGISTHNEDTAAHGQTTAGRALLTAASAAAQRAAMGVDPTGTAAAAITVHDADPEAHGQTATGRALLTADDAAAARTALGFDGAAGAAAAGVVATHDADTGAHGQTATGRALLTAADAAAARTAAGAEAAGSAAAAVGAHDADTGAHGQTATGRALLTAADAAAARSAIGAAAITSSPLVGAGISQDIHRKLASVRLPGATASPVIALLGDSWIDMSGRFSSYFAERMYHEYGYGGPGFVTFGLLNPSVIPSAAIRPSEVAVALSAGWAGVALDGSSTGLAGPDGKRCITPTIGSTITVTISGSAAGVWPTQAKLLYRQQLGLGDFRWRVAGGTWRSVYCNTSPTEVKAVDLVAVNALPTSGPYTIEIEVMVVNSGGIVLYGLDLRNPAGSGVVIHKLGMSGQNSGGPAYLFEATLWAQAMGIVNPDATVILYGTNDQAGSTAQATVESAHTATIGRLRTARARADIVLLAAGENLEFADGARAVPMSRYRDAMLNVARAVSPAAGLIDLYSLWGSDANLYRTGTARVFIDNGDKVHPANAGCESAASLASQWFLV